MAWYYGTYSCGHEGRTNIVGPTKDRERKAEWHFSGMCPECYKKQMEEKRAAVNKEAAKKSEEMEISTLKGTERQVAWANTLRMDFLEKVEKTIGDARESGKKGLILRSVDGKSVPVKMEILYSSLYFGLEVKTDAKFWIDTRRYCETEILCGFVEEYKSHKSTEIPEEVKQEIAEEKEKATVVPEDAERKPGIVKIEFDSVKRVLTAKYEKNDDFISIVKDIGFRWDGVVWYKEITEYTGRQEERAAELGNKLLLDGFTVQFPNTEAKNMAVSGEFSQENDRWVKYNKEMDCFTLCWKVKSNPLYNAAKKIPGSSWKNNAMYVKTEYHKEICDFAETFGFSISKMARGEIDKQKEKEAGFETEKISEHIEEIISDEKRLEKSLKSGGTILEDLKDD